MGFVVGCDGRRIGLEGNAYSQVGDVPFIGEGPDEDRLASAGSDFIDLPGRIGTHVVGAGQRGRLLDMLVLFVLLFTGARKKQDRKKKQNVGNILFHSMGRLEG